MDTELFELCKEVYKRFPKWDPTGLDIWMEDLYPGENPFVIFVSRTLKESKSMKFIAPLYTSDYILERLPKETRFGTPNLIWYVGHWEACYTDAVDALWNQELKSHAANTPLKALLKLVIALDDAKELPHA